MNYFRIIRARHPKDKVWIRVSKKVSKRAVDRNKLKRQVREIIRPIDKDLSPYIISVSPSTKGVDFNTLKAHLLRTIDKH